MNAFLLTASAGTLVALAFLLLPLRAAGTQSTATVPALRTALFLALALPLAAATVYAVLGNRAALDASPGVAPAAAAPAAATDPQVQKMVDGLAARLQKDPSDAKGWLMLGRSYKVMGRLVEAEAAYDRAGPFIANNADELAQHADIAASNAGGRFAGKPARLLEQALKVDPRHPMALWLAGAAARENGDAAGAVAIWKRLLPLLPPDSDDARELRGQIVQAGGAP